VNTLVAALNHPEGVLALRPRQLGVLVSQARQARLLAALRVHLDRAGVLAKLPAEVSRHMDSALLAQAKQARDLRYELGRLREALTPAGLSPILLKGAAYIIGDIPAGQGRIISDIDLLVPRESIPKAESALAAVGWVAAKLDDYDEEYYRRWMHEIPPMVHAGRGSVIDLHHTILPPTAAPRVNAGRLFEALQPTPMDGVFALSPCDQIIHSATHLFHESEFHHALRDLWDLHQLLCALAATHGDGADTAGDTPHGGEANRDVWTALQARAVELDLAAPCYLALRYAARVFKTPVPAHTLSGLRFAPGRVRGLLWDSLFLRGAFSVDYPGERPAGRSFALWLLFVRGHFLRMPLQLLVPHLLRKAWRRQQGDRAGT